MTPWLGALLQIPLAFEATPDPALWRVRGAGAEIALRCDALDVSWPGSDERLRIVVADARPGARPEPSGPAAGRVHSLVGRDPARWRRDVALHTRLSCPAVRPDVDLVFHGNDGRVEFDLEVANAAALAGVTLALEGAASETLTPDGDVVLGTGAHRLTLRRPVTFQVIDGERRAVESRFVLREPGRLGFALGPHQPGQPLVVDPVLELSSYAGGKRFDSVRAVAVDEAGFVFVAGVSDSKDFPTTPGAFQPDYAGANDDVFDRGDAFVMKLAPGGASLVWATYFGGRDSDEATGVALAPNGDVVFVGTSESKDLPVSAGAFQPERNHDRPDAFAARLAPDGAALVYSTYLGGRQFERAYDVAVDAAGAATLVGTTESNDFPVTEGAFQPKREGAVDAFVSRLAPDGGSLLGSTYLGGKNSTGAFGVALGADGGAVVVGVAQGSSFPTSEAAFQPEYAGEGDAFVTRLAPDLRSLRWSTFLGGNKDRSVAFDLAEDVALDADENVYVVGETLSKDFPVTADAFDTECGQSGGCGQSDGFVAKLSADGCALLYGSYLGENDADEARAVAVDARGHAHVAGATRSNRFPVTADAFQPERNGAADAFLSELDAGGRRLLYSTFLGSDDDDFANGMALGGSLRVHVVGSTAAKDFPVAGTPFQGEYASDGDGFVSVFGGVPAAEPALLAALATTPNPAVVGAPVTTTLTLRNAGDADATSVAASLALDPALDFASATPSQGSCAFVAPTLSCALGTLAAGADASVIVEAAPLASGVLPQTAEVSASGVDGVRAAACLRAEVHDLAVVKLKAPKRLRVEPGVPATAKIKLQVQNRSSHAEQIADAAMLADLVSVGLTPTGPGCPVPAVALDPGSASKLPLELASKKKLKVSFEATIACAESDYRVAAEVDHAALDGLPDSHPPDDVCPRSPLGTDPNPDGRIEDAGCGAKQADGSLGADVVIDAEPK